MENTGRAVTVTQKFDSGERVTHMLKAIGCAALAFVPNARDVTFDDPCGSVQAMARAYADFIRAGITFQTPAAFDKLAAQYHITIHWGGR